MAMMGHKVEGEGIAQGAGDVFTFLVGGLEENWRQASKESVNNKRDAKSATKQNKINISGSSRGCTASKECGIILDW